MARFSTSGIDDIIESMKKLGELSGEVADEMLLAGAEQVKRAWRRAAEIHKLKLTGQLIESIGYAKKTKSIGDVKTIDIYPQGASAYTEVDGKRVDRKKPVRNAEIAFINHYGTSKSPGTHWVDTADALSEQAATDAMAEVWDKFLEKEGYI